MDRPRRRTVPVSLVMLLMLVSLGAVGFPAEDSRASDVVTGCDDISFPIEAAELIQLQLPADCFWVGKMIVDRGVGARVPVPGTGVHTQGHGKRRAKELSIETRADGSLQLAYVGDVVGAEILEEPPIPPIPGVPLDPDLGLDLPDLEDPDLGLDLPDLEDPDLGLDLPDLEDPDLGLDLPDIPDLEDPDLGIELPELPLPRVAAREPCSGCPPPCQDSNNYVVGYKEFGSYDWKVNRKSIPQRLGKRRSIRAIKRAFRSVKDAFNDCSLSEDLATRGSFQGRTGKRANLNKDGNCLKPDGTNVIDFGPFPAGGVTCTWYRTTSGLNVHLESDVRLSRSQRWTHKPGSSCSNRLDLRSLVTHEIGHVFGLGHVGEHSRNLTMTLKIPVCTTRPRTLGLGDIRGLKELY